jgi:prepilin peptidase CpaA
MAAGALWMGADLILPYVVNITIFGGVLSLLILAYRRYFPAHALALPGWAMRLYTQGSGIPYGIAIAASGLVLYPSTPWFHALSM